MVVGFVVVCVCIDHGDVSSIRAVIEMAAGSMFSGNSLTLARYGAPRVVVPCIVGLRYGLGLVVIVSVIVSCQNLVNYCRN